MRVLVMGASGFVGSRLVMALLADGHEVVASSREVRRSTFPAQVDTVRVDLESLSPDAALCVDIDVAYYLIHSLGSKDFAKRDRRLAERFEAVASAGGVDRVVYLSGISGEEGELSPHLRSRREVETILASGSFALTVLRAAVIIGAGSASFRIINDLTDRLPIMVVPKWVQTPCQPIAIADTVTYLVRLLGENATRGETYDIGGPSIWSYESLLQLTATAKGKRVFILAVPVMTPELSSYWLRLTTAVEYGIARSLAESMRYPVTVRDSHDLQRVIPITQTPIEIAVRHALDEHR